MSDIHTNNFERVPNPWDTVRDFERRVAEYAGAPFAVAVDSCTNALLLCLVAHRNRSGAYWADDIITLPCKTYVGVAQAVLNAGHKCKFDDIGWRGAYRLRPTQIVDSARRFTRNMYGTGMLMCLSFHYAKHLPIGRGGMILLDDKPTADILRRMRYDGRREGVAPTRDTFDVPGYHCLMEPELAARGLALMQFIPDHNEDLPNDDYADLSKFKMFTEGI